MDKKFLILVLGFMLIGVVLVSAALPSWQDKYVNDFGGVFNATQVEGLRSTLVGIDVNTTAEVVVVTDSECASKGGQSQYAFDLLNGWKVGKAEKDNGLLVLYCKEEKKIFIATGYGLEGILPDSKIGRLLDENYVPLRDAGDAQGGIISFVNAVSLVIEENKAEVIAGKAGGSSSDVSFWWVFVIFMLIMIFVRIFSGFRGVRCKKDGLKMKKIGRKGNYYLYKCPNGHISQIAIAAAAGYFIGRGLGGFGGGFGGGGGGFGGGAGGGGGAGR